MIGSGLALGRLSAQYVVEKGASVIMREVVLGKSGLRVSAVGFGSIPIRRLSEDDAVKVIQRALDLGVTFIDTAAGYTTSEARIGKAIKGRRDGLVLATKSGVTGKEEITKDIEQSLRDMGTETIDLFQFHGTSTNEKWEAITAPGGAMEAVLAARDKGDIQHIGITSHSLDFALELVEEEIFETIQFPFNLVTCEPAEKLIPRARERDLGSIVMKPLCGGQYDNANLAFKFLNGYPDLVPIPGIEKVEEIEEIVALVESGATLEGEEKAEAEKVAMELGKEFCRRCRYCEPCPQGAAVSMAMIFDSFVKCLPAENLKKRAPKFAENLAKCVECGECEEKCPYDLPIMAKLKEVAAAVEQIVGE